jgi:hypothetical protein
MNFSDVNILRLVFIVQLKNETREAEVLRKSFLIYKSTKASVEAQTAALKVIEEEMVSVVERQRGQEQHI